MQTLLQLFTDPNSNQLLLLFVKSFAVFFSALYLLYTVILTRQVQIMIKAVTTKTAPILIFLTAIQILFAVILIVASVTLI